MDQQPLHPNLARLAAAYDEICVRWSRGELNAADARGQIAALVARDDTGVHWQLNASDGKWQFRTRTGEWRKGEPPTYGYASVTPHDLTRAGQGFNPDSRISFYEVDESLLYPPTSLAGATRRPQEGKGSSFVERFLSTPAQRIAAGVLLLVLLVLAFLLLRSDAEVAPAPAPVPAPAAPAAPAPAPK